MVEGKQEIRVNFEVRELIVAGIVCPEGDNTIDSSKIAQARIAYGGRGQITEMQQNRYGEQIFTCYCRSSRSREFRASRSVSHRASASGVNNATSGCSTVGGRDRIEAKKCPARGRAFFADKTVSVVPINAFATLVPLLRFNRQRRDRARFQAP